MPLGTPPSPDSFIEKLENIASCLQLPSFSEFYAAISSACNDSAEALKSIGYLVFLTFRPMFILLGLFVQFLTPYLRVIAKFAFRLFGHGLVKLHMGAQKFIAFQKSLSRAAILVEIGFVLALIGLYLLRRYIQKKRYVERVQSWYAKKKKTAQNKYNKVVKRISETSMTFALLLPHIIYIVLSCGIKIFVPSLLQYLVVNTYIISFLSLCIPLFRTVMFLSGKRKKKLSASQEAKSDEQQSNEIDKAAAASSTTKRGTRSKGNVANKYLEKTSGSKGSVANKYLEATAAKKKTSKSQEEPKQQSSSASMKSDEPVVATDDMAIELLRYWVVYSLIESAILIMASLPFLARTVKKVIAFGTTSPPEVLWEEFLLFFWIWLRYLPTPTFNNSPTLKGINKIIASSPIQMVYSQLSPWALHLADSNFSPPQQNQQLQQVRDHWASKFVSILDAAVFLRFISTETKQNVIIIISESRALLPACLTLFMPSTFTNYGCIYASGIVPSANSVKCLHALRHTMLRGSPEYKLEVQKLYRWLKFWVIRAFVQYVVLSSLMSFTRWIPLSTHATLILWLFLNLPLEKYGGTSKIYGFLEYELVGFGVLEAKGDEEKNLGFYDTMTVKFAQRVISSLPSSVIDDDKSPQNSKDAPAADSAESKSSDKVANENKNDSSVPNVQSEPVSTPKGKKKVSVKKASSPPPVTTDQEQSKHVGTPKGKKKASVKTTSSPPPVSDENKKGTSSISSSVVLVEKTESPDNEQSRTPKSTSSDSMDSEYLLVESENESNLSSAPSTPAIPGIKTRAQTKHDRESSENESNLSSVPSTPVSSKTSLDTTPGVKTRSQTKRERESLGTIDGNRK